MKAIIFGATGMVGQGVLRECLLAADVERVLCVGRGASGAQHPKLADLVHQDLFDYGAVEAQLCGFDACFFCIGVSAVGLDEAQYACLNHDMPLAAAATLARLNPGMRFVYISAAGADSSERGGVMWARVRGRTENDLLRLPFASVTLFRPGAIQPLHGIRSRTAAYRILYAVTQPLLPILRALFPRQITSTEELGCAMLEAARHGTAKPIVEGREIAALAQGRAR
jgi:uncharacterized protein YbjT (DUF2867 family)